MGAHSMSEMQSTTTVGHWMQDNCDVYVGRGDLQVSFQDYVEGKLAIGDRGWLGNPFLTYKAGGEYSHEESVARFAVAFQARLRCDGELRGRVAALQGEALGCWCQRLDEEDGDACHGEVIAHWADRLGDA